MPRAERSKKSTVSNTVETFQAVAKLPEPTRDLNPRAMTHFKAIVTSREVSTWAPIDVVTATNAAMTLAAIDDQWDNIEANGWMAKSDRGTPVKNPAADHLNALSSSLRSYLDKLGLSASMKGVAGSKQAGRNEAERKAREVIERASKDDLLA